MDDETRQTLDDLFRVLVSAIVLLAKLLGRPSPVLTRAERRRLDRREGADGAERP